MGTLVNNPHETCLTPLQDEEKASACLDKREKGSDLTQWCDKHLQRTDSARQNYLKTLQTCSSIQRLRTDLG